MAPLLSFRAGRAFRQGETNTVVSSPTRGLITIEEEDGLMHFYWKDLEANSIVEDLIIFPGDASFLKASDRVHVLKFSSSSARSFFWHQDVEADKDDERAAKVNELIGATLETSGATEGGEMEVEPTATTTTQDPFTTPAPTSRVAGRPRTTAVSSNAAPVAAPSTSTSSSTNVLGSEAQMAQLRNILAGIQGGSSGQADRRGINDIPEYQLQDVLSSSTLNSLLASPSPELLSRLAPLLPSILPSSDPDSLRRATTGTPEFRRSVAALDRALRTGALGPLVRGLGLQDDAANGVDSFLDGVRKQAERDGDDDRMQE